MSKYAIIIHGGCGAVDKFNAKERKAFLSSMAKILSAGEQLLLKGKGALDVAEHCIKLMENDPLYNAGKGSVLNEAGAVEMDAAIMDGRDLRAGAVAGVGTVKNPVQLARVVMEKTNHVMVIGRGAERLARTERLALKPKSYFVMKHRQEQLKKARLAKKAVLDHGQSPDKLGTVGVVVYDQLGNLAAATSTGGMTNKMSGRTGDSPLIGCGTYADNDTCGVSCTGRGEDFIRTSLAKFISDSIRFKGYSAQKAAKKAKRYFSETVQGYGGFILIDKKGRLADAYTTEGLIRGYVREGSKAVCKLFE